MSTSIPTAVRALNEGKLILFPTETVYGLGANACLPSAVAQIFELKRRPTFHPLICHVASLERALPWVQKFPKKAIQLAEAFWPGPLTLLLEKKETLSDLVTGGSPFVGIRVPSHPVALELLNACDFPVAAPSANLFGQASVTEKNHLSETLTSKVEFILDGKCEVGLESTILAYRPEDDRFEVLRLGGLELEKIEAVVGPCLSVSTQFKAPGTLSKHYAPHTPIRWWDGESQPEVGAALLTLSSSKTDSRFTHIEALSYQGDLRAAASRFFSALHKLDVRGFKIIYATRFPEKGLGRAMNDRIQRAVHSHSSV